RIRQFALILLGRDPRLGHRLIERGLSLSQLRLFLLKLLLCAAGIEADDRLAFFDRFARLRQPCDAQVGHQWGIHLNRAARLQFAAAANDHQEILLAGRRYRKGNRAARLPPAVNACRCAARGEQETAHRGPKPNPYGTRGHWPAPFGGGAAGRPREGAEEIAEDAAAAPVSTTTAAER